MLAALLGTLDPPALQLDGETLAIYGIGTAAVLALVFFAVKFAAGIREYQQVKRTDPEERNEREFGERESDERDRNKRERDGSDDARRDE